MRTLPLLLPLLLLACVDSGVPGPEAEKPAEQVQSTALQTIIDSAGVDGTILVFDPVKNHFISNDFEWCDKGFLPASTFKIVNSIIALETGVVEDDSTLFEWDGKPRRLKAWEEDLIFRDAFHRSCVPCYQQVAREIGPARMRHYLDTLQYGSMVVDSASIDVFWLEGNSRITPFQQVDFLYRFYHGLLPISRRTVGIMKRLMVIDNTDEYILSGKTGWAIRQGNNIGWFVGFLEFDGNTIFVATNVKPDSAFDMSLFAKIRQEITLKGLKQLGYIHQF